jgi:4'-phosphopantetheinyl transferase
MLHWQTPPSPLTLTASDVHIWRASLACTPAQLAHYQSLLSPDEQERASRFKFVEHYQHFIAGRGILRTLLGHYLAIAPQHLPIVYGAHGKPALAPAYPVQFNVAHSQGLALYGITRDRPIGIDLEHCRPLNNLIALARRFFAPSEQAALAALPSDQQTIAFFRYWTSKEAYLKATGIGLTQLQGLEIALAPGSARLVNLPAGTAPAGSSPLWQLQEFIPAAEFVGAIVTTGADQPYAYWQFTPA